MDARHIEDKVAWASNRVARYIGTDADAFRPSGPLEPLSPRNRYLRLPAIFTQTPTSFSQAPGYGSSICYGHFDHSYTRPGDYLVQAEQIVFIASQQRLQPVVCVRTNGRLTIRRPAVPTGVGGNGYGGLNADDSTVVLRDWPASVLGMSTGGTAQSGLPLDTTLPQWNILLPSLSQVHILNGDLVHDGTTLRGTVIAAESTFMGWRLSVRHASA